MKRIEALTFLRFFVAFTVITYHFGIAATGAFGQLCYHFAPRLMSFFFTLSGFVLMISYFERKEMTTRQFYVARLARVVPLYLLALALTVPFVYGHDIHNLAGLVLSATFLQTWVYPYNISFNDPAWSVSVEMFFYAIFPLLLYWVRKRNVTPKNLLLIALGVYIVTQVGLIYFVNAPFFQGFPSWQYSLVYFFPLPHFCSFLLGMAGGLLYLQNKDRVMASSLKSFAVLIAAFAADYLVIQYADRLSPILHLSLPTYSSFHSLTQLGLILAIAFTDNAITRVLSWKPFAILGGASYAVYILQRPFSLILRFALKRLFHIHNLPVGEAFLIIAISLTIISILVYLYVEPAGKKLIFKLDAWIRESFSKPTPTQTSV